MWHLPFGGIESHGGGEENKPQKSVVAETSDFPTLGKASAYLGVSKGSLRRWHSAGNLTVQFHPVYRHRLYLKDDPDDVVGERCVAERPVARSNAKKKKRKRARKF